MVISYIVLGPTSAEMVELAADCRGALHFLLGVNTSHGPTANSTPHLACIKLHPALANVSMVHVLPCWILVVVSSGGTARAPLAVVLQMET